MALSDLQTAAQVLGDVWQSNLSTPAAAQDAANCTFESEFTISRLSDDVNAQGAANALVEAIVVTVPRRATVVSVTAVPTTATALNADATNFAQFVIQSRASGTNGANALTLGTTNTTPLANTGTGNWSQWNAVAMNVTSFDPTNAVIPAGGTLTFKYTKSGVGVIVPAATYSFRIRYL
jgi:hypothetical protein